MNSKVTFIFTFQFLETNITVTSRLVLEDDRNHHQRSQQSSRILRHIPLLWEHNHLVMIKNLAKTKLINIA